MPTASRLGAVVSVGLLICTMAARADMPSPAPPLGRWLSQDHDGVFEITTCGETVCGRLVGINYSGAMPTDNSGHAQCGLLMLTGFRRDPARPERWTGMILDPERGRRYHAQIWSPKPGTLNLRGYLLLPLFGETQRWTRYDGVVAADCHFQPVVPRD